MRRLASVALIALLAALMAPPAAQAAAPWKLTMGQISVAPGGPERGLSLSISAPSPRPGGSQVVFDLTAAQGLVTLKLAFATGCVATETALTCPTTGLGSSSLLAIAAPDAPVGTVVLVPGRVVLDGATVAEATGTITIAEQVSLEAIDAQGRIDIATGATGGLAAGVRNTGTRPLTGVVLRLRTGIGLAPAEHANCERIVSKFVYDVTSGVVCLFDQELAPGQAYRLATPLGITATDEVWAPSAWYATMTWTTAQDYVDQGGTLPSGGSGPALELAPAAEARAVPQTGNTGFADFQIFVTGRNASTFTVTGDEAAGKVGETVTLTASIRNNGPARLEGYEQEWGSYLIAVLTPPPGTEIVKHTKLCRPFSIGHPTPSPPYPVDAEIGDGKLYCWSPNDLFPSYEPGKTYTFDVTLRIKKPGTLKGEFLSRLGGIGVPDGPVLQRGPLVVQATGAPASGDDGGEGGGGSLPITGTNTTVVALLGLALLVAGAATRLATRRR
ncbi:LPXTG cell wall anchor domain-containing protein [Actinoplanes sp. TRM 88003]|uniref:LPXTG cell wall anchor domain-containing protein n=1 Tax=Paractinoplanes aksuensis TaxID=2939490 RepID=A0ABT1DJU6_9ACTN|nr:LPXTG cell wall anchor domain-containing protein [Actinoplanes aksuensis]MCO8271107.1 LPXTG cell wall anchor domain-containing protein [Actinoplanes aksuensis]